MRLNKYLAAAGFGSRRSVEELVREGRVRINGRTVTDLATQVGPDDVVKVGSRVARSSHHIYAVLNKPRGYVCSANDEEGRKTIFELLPTRWPRVFHVGRLDMESEGLLLVTNDGDLSNHLLHPKFKMEKEYEVGIDRPFDPADTARLLRGIHIEEGKAKAENVVVIAPTVLRFTLTQGMKRQIREMLYRVGYEVKWLVRVRFGPVTLQGLPRGRWRPLTSEEIKALRAGSNTAIGENALPMEPFRPAPKPRVPAQINGPSRPRKERGDLAKTSARPKPRGTTTRRRSPQKGYPAGRGTAGRGPRQRRQG